jgi:hypothetical protein
MFGSDELLHDFRIEGQKSTAWKELARAINDYDKEEFNIGSKGGSEEALCRIEAAIAALKKLCEIGEYEPWLAEDKYGVYGSTINKVLRET